MPRTVQSFFCKRTGMTMIRLLRFMLLAAGVTAALLLTGCWDDAEINGRAFVLGFGADRGENAADYDFTFQLAIPVSGKSDSSGSIQYNDFTVTERTPAAAVRKLEKDLGRQINFEQLAIIVIGEKLSRESFIGLTDYFFRKASVRRQSCIAVCGGSAADFFAASPTDKAASTDAAFTLQSYDSGSNQISMDLFSFYKTLVNHSEFYLLRILPLTAETSGNPEEKEAGSVLSITGASVYGRNGEYRGDITENELELIRLTRGSVTDGALAVFDGAGNRYCCQVKQSDCSVKCGLSGDTPEFRLKLELVLVPLDAGGIDSGAYSAEAVRHIAESAEQTVTAQLEALAGKSRKTLGSSLLGLQNIIRQRQPEWYALHEKDWERIFPLSGITVEVECTAAGGGITK